MNMKIKNKKEGGKFTCIYDERNKITEILDNGVMLARYGYDDNSHLIREDNKMINKTSTYEYNEKGKIIKKCDYAFSLSRKLLNGELSEYRYSLTGDELISYNGEQFEYNGLGYPTKYRDANFKWMGNKLIEIENIAKYSYNKQGVRTSKTINNLTTKFCLNGNRILSQDNGTILNFHYINDDIEGFTLDVPKYFSLNFKYKKNVFGDVVGIYNSNDVLICKYVYDASGNCFCFVLNSKKQFVNIETDLDFNEINSMDMYVAQINPFRYRGYYYDVETGFYYTQNNNYYDCEIGKFVNPNIKKEDD